MSTLTPTPIKLWASVHIECNPDESYSQFPAVFVVLPPEETGKDEIPIPFCVFRRFPLAEAGAHPYRLSAFFERLKEYARRQGYPFEWNDDVYEEKDGKIVLPFDGERDLGDRVFESTTADWLECYEDPANQNGITWKMIRNGFLPDRVNPNDHRVIAVVAKAKGGAQ